MRRHAFTLIELLVVVTIITLLIAILLPSLSRAQKLAQSTTCQANLHQWGLIVFDYATDNSGAFPLYTTYITPYQNLRAYWQNEQIKLCPSAASPYKMPPLGGTEIGGAEYAYVEARIDTNGDGVRDYEIGSYTWNGMCNVRGAWSSLGNPSPYIPVNNYISRVSQADARVPLIGDGAWDGAFPGNIYWPHDNPDPQEWCPTATQIYSWGIPRYAIRRHIDDTVNLALADGHTENSKLPDLWVNYRWYATCQTGQPAPTIPWLNP
ncbi:MAG: prepilin-type N-terminal cleavage/methylation domain-containing protein [Planctomycetes bacterium]|nr:prepilin-type N-terminal cleavage/methylation domain-containing protein [Planctomycetota bacterium]